MFKDNLLMLRKAAGLSQEELAEKLDISRQTLSKYETGESLPDIEKCRMIADVFNVSLDDLVTYEPDGTWEQNEKGLYKGAELLSRLLDKMDGAAEEEGADYETMLTGGGREF